MVINVGRSEREERRPPGAEQQLRQHEDQHRQQVTDGAVDAVVAPPVQVVVWGERWLCQVPR